MGIVDLDLLFQIPKKDARIIEGKGEEESSKGSTMEVKNVLKSLRTLGKKPPFYTPSRGMTVGSKMRWANTFRRRNRCRRISRRNFRSKPKVLVQTEIAYITVFRRFDRN